MTAKGLVVRFPNAMRAAETTDGPRVIDRSAEEVQKGTLTGLPWRQLGAIQHNDHLIESITDPPGGIQK